MDTNCQTVVFHIYIYDIRIYKIDIYTHIYMHTHIYTYICIYIYISYFWDSFIFGVLSIPLRSGITLDFKVSKRHYLFHKSKKKNSSWIFPHYYLYPEIDKAPTISYQQ